MKRKTITLSLIAAACAIGWSIKPTTINWRHGTTWRVKDGTTYETGLRSDGVVVWRSITEAHSVVTNSPSEAPDAWWYSTNGIIILTNNWTQDTLEVK